MMRTEFSMKLNLTNRYRTEVAVAVAEQVAINEINREEQVGRMANKKSTVCRSKIKESLFVRSLASQRNLIKSYFPE